MNQFPVSGEVIQVPRRKRQKEISACDGTAPRALERAN